jgi:hypothetical protein
MKRKSNDVGNDTPWQRGMRQFHRQTWKGGGAFQTEIIRHEHKPALLAAGEEHKLKTISEWVKAVYSGCRPLCLACDHEFTPHDVVPAFCFSLPFYDKADQAIVTGICEQCGAKSDAELLEIAYQGFKELGLANRKLESGTA